MSSNVGLSTPRGSGTSGYVQRNLSHLKPRDTYAPYPNPSDSPAHQKIRKPDKDILNHDRLREIEVRVFELRDKLEDEEVEESEIEERTERLRGVLLEEAEGWKGGKKGGDGDKSGGNRQFKLHQVHEAAEAKIKETERARKAFGIREDYEEGSHWKGREGRLRDALGGVPKETS
ncbi:RNA-splicing factor [Bacidia gigantensis]|uniref:RNA-splicing factor n=1 Tax=Bacidia gigantensis TaxID=2732470 RepID=UPI001D058171|nr:RNA-splicing factor [Bacidia gigantensis]KAG8531922.1 RNA-splicing factor [Bacidia gigantensis]